MPRNLPTRYRDSIGSLAQGVLACFLLLTAVAAGEAWAATVTLDGGGDPVCDLGTLTCTLEDLSPNIAEGQAGDDFELIFTLTDMLHIELAGGDVLGQFDGLFRTPDQSTELVTSVIEVAFGDENGELITPFVEFQRFDCDSLISCGIVGALVEIPDAGGQKFHDVRFRWSTSTEAIDPIPVDVRITAIRILSNGGRVGAW